MNACSKHKTYVSKYAGDLKQLARDLADLRYDAFADLLMKLSSELSVDAGADRDRGRKKLSSALGRSVNGLMSAWSEILSAWRNSKPHMDVQDEYVPRRIAIQALPVASLKDGENYLVCYKDGEYESWMFASHKGGVFSPEDGATFTISGSDDRYSVFSHPHIGPRSDKTYHVSGHIDLTESEFKEHYVPRLDKALEEGARFVVGDAKGADGMAFDYLDERTSRVVMYHMFTSPRNNAFAVNLKGGYKSDDERDAAMTADSDEDIAWIRPGRERSGTAKNLQRRKEKADAHKA